MELGQRLRQARLEAGLSQRQLCGDTITRNMLSQIENGSARPSMDTLMVLSARLKKPLSFFLEENAVLSPNQDCILRARAARGAQVLEILQSYQAPDPLFDPERYLLEVLACMDQAASAIAESRLPYALALLEQAASAGSRTPYYTPALERQRLLLCYQAEPSQAAELVSALPDNSPELLLRAAAALESGSASRCMEILAAVEQRNTRWYYLYAEACFARKDYTLAAAHYRHIEEAMPQVAYPRLERCYKELEDYKMAYLYACKQR